MIPVSLTLSGFLSYREPVTLDFSGFDLACIAGSNGAGKSSLLDAMTYALFGKARRTDEMLINMRADSAFVELVFEYETNRYRIQRTNPRGKATVLEFQIALPGSPEAGEGLWKPLTERTLRDTQRRIEETLRLDYDTFVNAAFFLQGRADQFTQQTPTRRKAILASILGLDVWETYRQQALSRRRLVEAEVQALDGRLAEINAELSQEGERRELLKALNAELDRMAAARAAQEGALETARKLQAAVDEQARMVEMLAQHAEGVRQRVLQLGGRLESRREERSRHTAIQVRAEEIRQAHEALQEARARLAAWDEAARSHESRRRGPQLEIENARAALEAERRSLVLRASEAEQKESGRAALAARIMQSDEELAVLQARLAGRETLEEEIKAARDRLAAARAENPRLKAEMDELRKRIDQLEQAPADAAACPVCGQPLSPGRRGELIAELTAAGTLKGDQYRANRDLLKEADELAGALAARAEALKAVEADERRLEQSRVQLESQRASLDDWLADWSETGAPRLDLLAVQLDSGEFADEARAALAAIDAELLATGYDAAEHDRIRTQVSAGAGVDEDLRALERAAAALEPLEREIGELEVEAAAVQTELAGREQAHLAAVSALAVLKADAPDMARAQKDLLDLKEAENRLRMSVGSAQQKVDVLESLQTRKAVLDAERAGLAQTIAHFKQLEKAFGKDGVPALLIEQAIPQIEGKANELLERLSGGEMAVRFQTQRELKSREDLRETLDIIISDRAGTRDYEMYSGGEAFRVDFAIRLALSEVLSHRAGARLQTLVIDEGFGSQDESGRQRLIEAINMVRVDFAKVLVITHIESLKDAFPTRIEVTKGVEGSELRVVQN